MLSIDGTRATVFDKLILIISLPSLIILCITLTMSCISLTWKSLSVSGGSPKSNFQFSRRNLSEYDKIDFDIVMLARILLRFQQISRGRIIRVLIWPLRYMLTQIYQKRESYKTFAKFYIFFFYYQTVINVNNIQIINAE